MFGGLPRGQGVFCFIKKRAKTSAREVFVVEDYARCAAGPSQQGQVEGGFVWELIVFFVILNAKELDIELELPSPIPIPIPGRGRTPWE